MIEADRDILIELRADVRQMKASFDNHLAHHWAVTLAAVVAFLGAVATMIATLTLR